MTLEAEHIVTGDTDEGSRKAVSGSVAGTGREHQNVKENDTSNNKFDKVGDILLQKLTLNPSHAFNALNARHDDWGASREVEKACLVYVEILWLIVVMVGPMMRIN